MNVERILVPTDFSDGSRHALAYAEAIARDTGASLVIAYVEPPEVLYGADELYPVPQVQTYDMARQALAEFCPSDPQIKFEHEFLVGAPEGEILRLAAEKEVDLIVMSTHGRTGLSRVLMGSIAEAVVRKAPCPVITIRQPGT